MTYRDQFGLNPTKNSVRQINNNNISHYWPARDRVHAEKVFCEAIIARDPFQTVRRMTPIESAVHNCLVTD